MSRKAQQLVVTLANSENKLLELSYVLNETQAAKIWLECLSSAIAKSKIAASRFYNFRNRPEAGIEKLTERLEETVALLTQSIPQLKDARIDSTNSAALQKSLNELHTQFAHSHLIEKNITNQNRELWSEFNALIHQIESALIAKNLQEKKESPLEISRIELTWKEDFKTTIPQPCFDEFTLQKKFGSIQINYCQVGRNLHEIFFAQDDSVPAEHIQPARFFSANSTLWFGPDLNENYEKITLLKIKEWFLKSEQKFNSAGVFWDRPDKALGAVTVAQLDREFKNIDEKLHFQNEISKFSEIRSVSITT